MIKIIETHTPGETYSFGKMLGEKASPGDVLCLNGELGVGKTVFAQGFAEGLDIHEPVVSPTFTILQEYENGRLPLYHFDVYRIEEPEEMEEIGYEDYFFGEGVTLIEWSTLIAELIPNSAKKIVIEKDPTKGDDYRKITLLDPEA